MRLLTRFPSGYVQFIILAPLIMKGSGGEAMSSDQVKQAFVGNTVVLQRSELRQASTASVDPA